MHTHIYTDQAYQEYVDKIGNRLKHAIVIQYWVHGSRPKYELDYLIEFAASRKLQLIAAINIDGDVLAQLRVLEQCRDSIVGLKLYPGYQYFYPSDEVVYPVVEFCQAYGKTLMIHTGATSARGEPLLKYALPIHVDELAVRYPECKIIIAHFGFPYFLETATILSKNKNVFADISGTIDQMPSDAAQQRIIDCYVSDLKRAVAYYPDIVHKILFGTDFSGDHSHLSGVKPYIEVVDAVFGLDERLDVFQNNALRLFS